MALWSVRRAGGQGNGGVGFPGALLFVNRQHPWDELDFMAEQLERNRAGQRSHVHENALAERNVERHGLRLRKSQRAGKVCRRDFSAGEHNPQVCDGEPGLVDDDGGRAGNVMGEGYLPRAITGSTVLDDGINDGIPNQRDDEDEEEVSGDAVGFHLRKTFLALPSRGSQRTVSKARLRYTTARQPLKLSRLVEPRRLELLTS